MSVVERSIETNTTVHNGAVVCHHTRYAVVRWLLLFIAYIVGRIVSEVRVSTSFQIIPPLVGQLGSEPQRYGLVSVFKVLL